MRRRRLEAQQLLDGLGISSGFSTSLSALIGVLGEHLRRPTDEPCGGLVARARHHVEVDKQFLGAQAPDGAGSSVNSTLSSSVMMSSDGLS